MLSCEGDEICTEPAILESLRSWEKIVCRSQKRPESALQLVGAGRVGFSDTNLMSSTRELRHPPAHTAGRSFQKRPTSAKILYSLS